MLQKSLILALTISAMWANAQVPAPPAGPGAPAVPAPMSPPPTPPETGGALKAPTGAKKNVVPKAKPKPSPGSSKDAPAPVEPEPEPASGPQGEIPPAVMPPGPAPRPIIVDGPSSVGPFTPHTGMDRLLRPWNVSFDLSTISLFVPLKPGATVSYAYNPEYTIELSAMSGGLSAGWLSAELGRYTETSYSAVVRSYGARSSFHYLIGVSQENTLIKIGNRYVDMATGAGSIDIAQTQSWALVLGLGQNWKLRNGMSFGVDYARIAYPLIVSNTDSPFLNSTADGEKKGFIADTLNTAAKIPRLSFLQLNIGYSF